MWRFCNQWQLYLYPSLFQLNMFKMYVHLGHCMLINSLKVNRHCIFYWIINTIKYNKSMHKIMIHSQESIRDNVLIELLVEKPVFCFLFDDHLFHFLLFFKIFIVIQLQLCAFSPHPSTPPQLNPPPSPTSTLLLGFVHVSFIVVPVIPSSHCPRAPPPRLLLDCS